MDLLEQVATPSEVQPTTSSKEIPEGFCQCGCGKKTRIAKHSNKAWGWVKGKPIRYVHGHQGVQTGPDYEVRDCGYLTPCWVWLKSIANGGYGRVWDSGTKKHKRAHRVYYERLKGPIPEGLGPDHLCRNPPCINPDHMQLVPQATNVRRGAKAHLIIDDVVKMIAMRKSGIQYKDIAIHFGQPISYVQSICKGKRWKGVVPDEELIKPKRRLTVDAVRKIKQLKASGMNNKDIAVLCRTSVSNVYAILQGRNWAHVKL
jgi:hypothetical protein